MKNTQMIYGFHAIESLIKKNPEDINKIWIDEKRKDKRVQSILKLIKENKIKHEQADRNTLNEKSKTEKNQGIVAECVSTENLEKVDLTELVKKEDVFILILDSIQDPHNFGAILRSANAAGIDAVIIPKNKAVGITPVVRKIASGGAENTPIIQVTNISQTIKTLKENGIWCIGAAGEAKNDIYNTDFKGKTAIVMGSEGPGIKRLIKENCDFLTKIPMKGVVESLNVSVATGVILFEAVRQRRID